MTTRTYYDVESTEGRAIHARAGIRPSKAIQRVHRVVAHAVKVLAPPFDDRSRLPTMRRYITRMKLTPAQPALLVRTLGSHDVMWPLPIIASGTAGITGRAASRRSCTAAAGLIAGRFRVGFDLLCNCPRRSSHTVSVVLPHPRMPDGCCNDRAKIGLTIAGCEVSSWGARYGQQVA